MKCDDQFKMTIQSAYEEEYSAREIAWRELAGKYKANNILSVCKSKKFTKVLECGAGDGSVLKYINDSDICDELYATEISNSAIKQIEKRNLSKLKEAVSFDGYHVPYEAKYFDLAYCSHVIEHVEHPRVLLRELQRVSHHQVFEIPLDYLKNVDDKVEYFLSYGHINIYTPSLFKFLLKSEGFEIKEELFSTIADEVLRFSWYTNLKQKQTIAREMKMRLYPAVRLIKRLVLGHSRYHEYEYDSYTCLAKGGDKLVIATTGGCND